MNTDTIVVRLTLYYIVLPILVIKTLDVTVTTGSFTATSPSVREDSSRPVTSLSMTRPNPDPTPSFCLVLLLRPGGRGYVATDGTPVVTEVRRLFHDVPFDVGVRDHWTFNLFKVLVCWVTWTLLCQFLNYLCPSFSHLLVYLV